jgi:hypothetical protein
MKLYGLYLEQELPGLDPEVPDPRDEQLRDKSRLQMAKKQVDSISGDLKRSLRGVIESLKRLPVIDTDTQAKESITSMMASLNEFMESFEEDGTNFNMILSAIMAGGK